MRFRHGWEAGMRRARYVDYINYILAVLVIGLVCLAVIRLVSKRGSSDALARLQERQKALEVARKEAMKPRGKRGTRSKVPGRAVPSSPVLQREILHVRTPWGWPNHPGSSSQSAGLSGAMQSLTDRLVREKKLAHSPDTNHRVNGSVRALLEDRYGRVNRGQPDTIPYQKVKKPLLRDPKEPHDQMDNFGTAEAERIRQKLRNVNAMGGTSGSGKSSSGSPRYVEIKDIKQPWGW
jgi:hypothetical protein